MAGLAHRPRQLTAQARELTDVKRDMCRAARWPTSEREPCTQRPTRPSSHAHGDQAARGLDHVLVAIAGIETHPVVAVPERAREPMAWSSIFCDKLWMAERTSSFPAR